MLIQPYAAEELQFAYCYRVYYRWQTHRLQTIPALRRLDQPTLHSLSQPFDIHTLECSSTEVDLRTMLSLRPRETVSRCASKIKGRVSSWLNNAMNSSSRDRLLGGGYFACTAGATNTQAVKAYLDEQGQHHGYSERARPPVFVHEYPSTEADEARVATDHAVTLLRFHVVLAVHKRRGVFGQDSAPTVAEAWRRVAGQMKADLRKVSFVPDHVHLAVRVHPTVSPAELTVQLMNTALEDAVIRAGVERLWAPSAYLGSYGDLETAKLRAYIQRWERRG